MKLFSNFLVMSALIILSGAYSAKADTIHLYQVSHEADFYNFYRTPLKTTESLSQIANLKMNFRKLEVNEETRTITYGPMEAPQVPDLNSKQIARLIDWNWKRLQDAWFLTNKADRIELKNLEELTQDEVSFDLLNERESFRGFQDEQPQDTGEITEQKRALQEGYAADLARIRQLQRDSSLTQSEAEKMHKKVRTEYEIKMAKLDGTTVALTYKPGFQRRPGGRVILSFKSIERDEDGKIWLILGDESEQARRGILDSSLSSWDEKIDAVSSFDYAFELGQYDIGQ